MNDHDRNNLNFLLTIDPETFTEWYDQTDEDDREYAQELLALAAEELREQAIALRIEAELSVMESFEQAQAVIGNIKG
jgi:hypothetical protein